MYVLHFPCDTRKSRPCYNTRSQAHPAVALDPQEIGHRLEAKVPLGGRPSVKEQRTSETSETVKVRGGVPEPESGSGTWSRHDEHWRYKQVS